MRALLAPWSWAAHLLLVGALCFTGVLGAWQLERWSDARADATRDRSDARPVPLDAALEPNGPFGEDAVGRPVAIEGRWLPEASVLVSGREQDGEPGSWVATPLVSDSSGSAIYVVRGFTTGDADPGAPTGDAELVALLQPPEGTGVVDDDAGDDVLPQLRTADLVQRQTEDLYGGYAVLDPARSPDAGDAAAGLQPATPDQLPTAAGTTALRNILYALEWWLFGLFAAFVWWRWARDLVRAERVARDPARDPGHDPEQGPGQDPARGSGAEAEAIGSPP